MGWDTPVAIGLAAFLSPFLVLGTLGTLVNVYLVVTKLPLAILQTVLEIRDKASKD